MGYQDEMENAGRVIRATGLGTDFEDRRWLDRPGREVDEVVENNIYRVARKLDVKPGDVTADMIKRNAGYLKDLDLNEF